MNQSLKEKYPNLDFKKHENFSNYKLAVSEIDNRWLKICSRCRLNKGNLCGHWKSLNEKVSADICPRIQIRISYAVKGYYENRGF